jgi:hypothetical protein
MAKDFSSSSDISSDIGGAGAGSDFGGDLAGDQGVDLNGGIDNTGGHKNSSPNMSKSWGTKLGILGGVLATPGVAVAGTDMPNEHVQGIMNEPTADYHQIYERPDPRENMIAQGAGPANESEVIDVPIKPETEQRPPNPPPDYVGQTPEQVAEQIAEQQGYRIVLPETQDTEECRPNPIDEAEVLGATIEEGGPLPDIEEQQPSAPEYGDSPPEDEEK